MLNEQSNVSVWSNPPSSPSALWTHIFMLGVAAASMFVAFLKSRVVKVKDFHLLSKFWEGYVKTVIICLNILDVCLSSWFSWSDCASSSADATVKLTNLSQYMFNRRNNTNNDILCTRHLTFYVLQHKKDYCGTELLGTGPVQGMKTRQQPASGVTRCVPAFSPLFWLFVVYPSFK